MANISCKKVRLNYYQKNELETLKDITLNLPSKGILGVVGPSGSGKSSFLYALAGMKNKYVKGEILYDGNDITTLDENTLAEMRRKKCAFIFQKHYLIQYLNVLENIQVSKSDVSNEEIDSLLKKLGIEGIKFKFPKEISGGESQRVAIIRAFANRPEIVFADEPTAALDSKYTQIVMELFREKSKDCLVILVSHDRNVFKYFNYKIELEDGRIIARDEI